MNVPTPLLLLPLEQGSLRLFAFSLFCNARSVTESLLFIFTMAELWSVQSYLPFLSQTKLS